MLVLSRKKDETIIIGDNIELTVVEIKGDTVKLGINAPREVKIFRGELLQAIREQNIEAAAPLAVDLDALTRKIKRKSE